MKNTIVFVTGFFGAPVMQTALKIADEENLDIISLDDEIEKNDGRSVRRICMVMGEHEYRNKEYEALICRQQENGNLLWRWCSPR